MERGQAIKLVSIMKNPDKYLNIKYGTPKLGYISEESRQKARKKRKKNKRK